MKVAKKRELLTASNFIWEVFNKIFSSWGTSKEMDLSTIEWLLCKIRKRTRGLLIISRPLSFHRWKCNSISKLNSKEMFLPKYQNQNKNQEMLTSSTTWSFRKRQMSPINYVATNNSSKLPNTSSSKSTCTSKCSKTTLCPKR